MENTCHILLVEDDPLLHILQYLDYTSCLLFFSTCRTFRAIYNEEFWKRQTTNRFGIKITDSVLIPDETNKDRYIRLAAKRNEFGPGSERYMHTSTMGYYFLDIHILYRNYFMAKCDKAAIKSILVCAARKGHTELVKLMITKNADNYHFAMSEAARGGYIDIVQLILNERELNPSDYFLTMAISNAAEGGHMNIVQLMLTKMTVIDQTLIDTRRIYNATLICASLGGHMEIVKLMLNKGATNYNLAMALAAKRGHMDIVQLMLNKEADDYDETMKNAAGGGHIAIVRLMLEKGANNFNEAMLHATRGGHINIVRLILLKGANNYGETMVQAARCGYIDILQLMLDNGAKNEVKTTEDEFDMIRRDYINVALEWAARAGYMDIIGLMLSKGANTYGLALISAAKGGHNKIAQWMIDLGSVESDVEWPNLDDYHYNEAKRWAKIERNPEIIQLIENHQNMMVIS